MLLILASKLTLPFEFWKKNCIIKGILKTISSIVSCITRINVQHSSSDLWLNRVALSFCLVPRSIYFDAGFGDFFSDTKFVCKKLCFFILFFVIFDWMEKCKGFGEMSAKGDDRVNKKLKNMINLKSPEARGGTADDDTKLRKAGSNCACIVNIWFCLHQRPSDSSWEDRKYIQDRCKPTRNKLTHSGPGHTGFQENFSDYHWRRNLKIKKRHQFCMNFRL